MFRPDGLALLVSLYGFTTPKAAWGMAMAWYHGYLTFACFDHSRYIDEWRAIDERRAEWGYWRKRPVVIADHRWMASASSSRARESVRNKLHISDK